MRRSILAGWFFLILFSFYSFVYAQGAPKDETQGVRRLKGIVVSVDWVASTIVVRWLDKTVYDEMSFKVSSDVRVYVHNFPAQLSDIQQSDDVTIEYFDNGYAGLKVLSVTVTSPLSGD